MRRLAHRLLFVAAAVACAAICALVAEAQTRVQSRGPAVTTYLSPATGAVARPTTLKLGDIVSVKDFGAKGDGTTDDTAAIQAAINSLTAGVVVVPGGATYLVSTLAMTSGVWLSLDGATLKMKAGAPIGGRLLNFAGVSNSGLLGAFTLDGNRANQTNTGDSGQFGVYIGPGASDIYIQAGYGTGWAGDSLYIGSAGTAPTGVVVDRWIADNAFRNGVSITNARNVRFDYLETRLTHGAAPQAGIDLETNTSADVLTNISFGHLVTHDNTANGFQILGQLNGTALVHGDVTIERLDSYSNGLSGGAVAKVRRVSILSGTSHDNAAFGLDFPRDLQHIRVRLDVYQNSSRGVSLVMTTQDFASSDFDFSGSTFVNNSQGAVAVNDGLRIDSDDAAKVLTRVYGDGVRAYDDQATKTQRYGISASANTSAIEFSGYVPPNATGNYLLLGQGYVETAPKIYTTATLNHSIAIANANVNVQSATVNGAAVGDTVIVTPTTVADGMFATAIVSAANTVKITIANLSGASQTPGNVTYRITVIKH